MFVDPKEIVSEPAANVLNEFFSHHESDKGAPAKDILLIRGTIAPGAGHDFHLHEGREEFLYILKGKIEQWIGEEMRIVGPGDVIYVPEGVVHGSFNVGDDDAQLLAIFNNKSGSEPLAQDLSQEEPWVSIRG